MYVLRLARLGQTMEEGMFTAWLKPLGTTFEQGEIIYEIATEKTAMEVEATRPGRFVRFIAEKDELIPVGGVLAVVAEGVESPTEADIDQILAADAGARVEESAEFAAEAAVEAKSAPASEIPPVHRGKVAAAPAARRLAAELNVDLSSVTASSSDGVISAADVRAAASKGD